MIKAIFFDWGYTFAKNYEIKEAEADKLLAPFGFNWKNFIPMWRKGYLARSRGEIRDDVELKNFFRKETGKEIPVKEIVKSIIECHEIPKENIEMVKELKKNIKSAFYQIMPKNGWRKCLKDTKLKTCLIR